MVDRTPEIATPMPGWVRIDALVTDSDEAAFRAGAALAMLDCRARASVPFAGVWRRRLALKAAAASARIARRGEDEATRARPWSTCASMRGFWPGSMPPPGGWGSAARHGCTLPLPRRLKATCPRQRRRRSCIEQAVPAKQMGRADAGDRGSRPNGCRSTCRKACIGGSRAPVRARAWQ
jgi:hypothetical protein